MNEILTRTGPKTLSPEDMELLRGGAKPRYPKEEFVRRGEAIYREKIEPTLKPEDDGKLVVIDIETGEFEIGTDEEDLELGLRLRRRVADPQILMLRVGYEAVYSLGRHPLERRQKR